MSEAGTAVDGQAGRTQTASQENTEVNAEDPAMEQESEEDSKTQLPPDLYYEYEELHSRPFITPDSEIPENLLRFLHSFGYDSGRRANLQLLDDTTLIFIAGNLLVLLDISTKEQRYLRSCGGGGISSITTHPSKQYFAVAEKGNQPNIIIYEYPSLRPHRILRGGTEKSYSFVEFNHDGSLLASVGDEPDFTVTLWDWRQEQVKQSCRDICQEVYRMAFSPFNPNLLASSGSGHIKFWKIAATFTGAKLQGLIGHFGKTAMTDINGFVHLPDGKVVSGTDWGNLLLWEMNTIKVEICRTEGQHCHTGTVQPFALEDGLLMTFGSDGVIRGWDCESINMADCSSHSSKFEMEPMNEMVVGHHVCLSSVVKSSLPDSPIWFAQDSNGAIWKLDLSFTYTTPDPECMFTFHSGPILGLDVSRKSHLMATTAQDRSVRVFDFLEQRELTSSNFNQGGTALSWASPGSGSLLVAGFEDGVVRLLELYNPQKLRGVSGRVQKRDAELRLKQAFKPHSAPVTALAFDTNGAILATGSSDSTVFFFSVGDKYNPIGFVSVPGPVQALQWSPPSHSENKLLILCQSAHVVEVDCPDPDAERPSETFLLSELPSRFFKFRSIKSQIKREEARREAEEEKKGEETEEVSEELMEEDLPPVYIPDPPSPLCCGFYSQPGHFWLSMGGFDSGFLYHCKFSEEQDQDPDKRQDEPFDFLSIHDADSDPVCSVTFSSTRQLLLCGMHSGAIRIYPLKPEDHLLTSMQTYWTLSVHDNHSGHLRHICCSYDDHFVLTGGDDGNIFSFTLLSPKELEKLQKMKAKVPSPRAGLDQEPLAQDIEDPAAYNIETAKQKLDKDRLQKEARLKIAAKRKKLDELKKKFKQLLSDNHSLPEHVRLRPEELQLDPCFSERAERVMALRVKEVEKEMSWEVERCSLALSKLQDWFRDSLTASEVTVVAIRSDHRVSAYRVSALRKPSAQPGPQSRPDQINIEPAKTTAKDAKASSDAEEEEATRPLVAQPTGIKVADRQFERLRKAAEKAERARARIEKRKQEWDQLYAEKPDKNCEDPQDAQAIMEARENMGDLKLKSAKDFTAPGLLNMNAERKRAELTSLEEKINEQQTEMNRQIVALRDSKVHLLSQLRSQAQQIKKIQQHLPTHLHHSIPPLPLMLPEETPEEKLQYSHATLERYRTLKEQRSQRVGQGEDERSTGLLRQLEEEMAETKCRLEEEEEQRRVGGTVTASSATIEEEEEEEEEAEEEELSQLEEEFQKEEEIRLVYEQRSLLDQMDESVCRFDAELLLLRHKKLRLDWQLKLAELHQLTLYQELLILMEFEPKMQNKELKQEDITTLEERKKALTAAFETLLGEESEFRDYLTAVFTKNVKQVKETDNDSERKDAGLSSGQPHPATPSAEKGGGAEDSDKDSDEDIDEDEDGGTEDEEAAVDDSVCPLGCDPDLFEKTLQLREHRWELDKVLKEKMKKNAEAGLGKDKMAKSGQAKTGTDTLSVCREIHERMNELDVVVPLRLSQIEFFTNGSVPSDLSSALVVDRAELSRLQERIQQLVVEKSQQEDVYSQAHQQYGRLIHDCRDMNAKIEVLKEQCTQLMMQKFGRMVDLEALQTMTANSSVEELKHQKLLNEAAYAEEIKQWDAKVEEARDALMMVTRQNTECVASMKNLLDEKRDLEQKLNTRQRKVGRMFQGSRRQVDYEETQRLKELVKKQSLQAEALRNEIYLLRRKGGLVEPPGLAALPPLAPSPTSTESIFTSRQGSGHQSRKLK
ncbi:uncharacterized protein V6R79_007770 [Siganus canaliculatus]